MIQKQHEIARHALARILTGSLAALLVLSVLVLPAAPAQATCSGSDSATTNSSQSNWYGQLAYWDPGTMFTAGAPCSDVNVRQWTYTSTHARGSYFSSSTQTWKHGSAGWVTAPEGYLVVVISSLSGTNIEIRVGTELPSAFIQVLT